jgi:superfamily II DNA/RNA helicase
MTSPHHRSNRLFAPLLGLILLAWRTSAIDITKSPDDYFHSGAMAYLTNNIPAALNFVTNGLEQYPDDEKLKKLEALLKQQQQQQQKQQQNQDQKQDQQKQQDQKKDQSQQSKQDDKQKSDEQKQKEDQDKQRQAQQPNPDDKKDSGEQQQAAASSQKPEQMTPEQAMRVLDTTKGEEKVLPIQVAKPPPTDKKLKDW